MTQFEDTESGDSLSKLALERRAKVEEESKKDKPSIIESVQQSEVIYSLSLSGMPYNQADFSRVSRKLEELYNVSPDPIDFSPLLKSMDPQQLNSLDKPEALRRLFEDSDSKISWSSGRYPTKNDYVEVGRIRCNYESVLVAVRGQSQVAEVIAQEVLEILWESTGVTKLYADIKKHVLLKGFATRTFLKLPIAFEHMLRPEYIDWLSSNMVEGEKLAQYMGTTTGEEREIMATVTLDEINLRVGVFENRSGNASTHDIVLTVGRRGDYGTGRVLVSSGLPYDRHEKLVQGLFSQPSSKT